MSHCRFALGFTRHKKVSRLSDSAFRLWVSAMHHARELGSDGFLDETELDMVPRCPPRGPKRKVLVLELTKARLWDVVDGGWQIHDYTHWQDSAEQVKKKRDAACLRAKTYRERKALRTSHVTHDETHDVTTDVPLDQSTSSSGSESGSPEGSPEGNPPEDPGRETMCPTDLAKRLEKNGTIARLAEQLSEPIESIRHEAEQFVLTWTFGKLAGQRRTGWAGKCRQWIIDQKGKGRLKPAGAIEHDRLNGRGSSGGSAAPSPYLAEAEQLLRERGRDVM